MRSTSCLVKAFSALIVLSICFVFFNVLSRHTDGGDLSNLMISRKFPPELASSSKVYNDNKRNMKVGTLLGTPKTVVALSYDGEENALQNRESKKSSSYLSQRVDEEHHTIKQIIYSPLILLSLNKSVSSDVLGNLGNPSVITQEQIGDWLKDRWQGMLLKIETT